MTQRLRERLEESGIKDIVGIPSDFTGLSWMQSRVRGSVAAGQPIVSPHLVSRLREIVMPASFLDFETLSPSIPMYDGTGPYQAIPVQWSLHILDADGKLSHSAFLHDGSGDPREPFTASLLEAIPAMGTIFAYSDYEARVMRDLAEAFPRYRYQLLTLCERLVDLLRLLSGDYYHPGFHGSFSLKSVLPNLVPALAYDDLEVTDDLTASTAYAGLVGSDAPQTEIYGVKNALPAHCARDTEAMVRIYEALMAEAG